MAKHPGVPRLAELVSGTLRVISVRINYMPVAEEQLEVIYNGNKAFVPLCAQAITTKCCVCACVHEHMQWHCRITINAVFGGHL